MRTRPDVEQMTVRWRHRGMKYAIGARSITPRAQNPMHPQNVRHRRPTNSIGITKLTTIVPGRQTERIVKFMFVIKMG